MRALYPDADADGRGLYGQAHSGHSFFLRGLNAEREWCAMSHVCWVRRRLVGGQQGRTQMYMGEVSMPGRAGAYISSRRRFPAVLSHHRAYRSVHGGFLYDIPTAS